jgi:hypothetical protein
LPFLVENVDTDETFQNLQLKFQKRPFITKVIDRDSSVSIVTGKGPGDQEIIFRFREMDEFYSLF